MATLGAADYRDIRRTLYRAGYGKEELKALAGGLPNEAALLAGMQSVEDSVVAAFSGWKSDLEAATGKTFTLAGAQKFVAAYMVWKIAKLLE